MERISPRGSVLCGHAVESQERGPLPGTEKPAASFLSLTLAMSLIRLLGHRRDKSTKQVDVRTRSCKVGISTSEPRVDRETVCRNSRSQTSCFTAVHRDVLSAYPSEEPV